MSTPNPTTVRIAASSGMDWILFDMEHGPPSIETVDGLVRGVMGAGALPLIRVVWDDMNEIKKALDTGAYGLVVPWVNSAEEAEKAVKYTRYMPEGLRGCAAGRPASAWGISSGEYMDIVNDEILVAVQIETKEAVENIEEILSVEGVDATFIGPSDLSASMGVRGQFWHPDVVKALGKVVEACDAAGVAPGIAFGRDLEHCSELIQQGFRFIGVGGDKDFLRTGCSEVLAKIRRQSLRTLSFNLIHSPGNMRLSENHKTPVDILVTSHIEGKYIAATCHGPLILAASGIVNGTRVTCYLDPHRVGELESLGALVETNVFVIRDGRIITGNGWDDIKDFASEIVDALIRG